VNFEKKYLYLSVSLLVKVILNIFIVFYVAKKVSVEDFGIFSLAFIISTLISLGLDYGFNLRVLSLTSKSDKSINNEISSMLTGKKIIMLFMIFCLILALCFYDYGVDNKLTIFMLAFSAFPNSFAIFYLNNFKVFDLFDKEAKGYLTQAVILVILLIVIEKFNYNKIFHFSAIFLISRIAFYIYAYYIFYSNKLFLITKTRFLDGIKSIKTSFSYAVHLILAALIIYIDTFILSFLTDLYQVGLYQSGMRIIMASLLVTVIINDSFIPIISRNFKNKKYIQKKLSKLFGFVLLLITLITITLLFYHKSIIMIIFSEEYLEIEQYIIYIVIIIALRYFGLIPGIILTSGDRQDIRARAVLISIIISVIFNLILIPIYEIKGAFISSLMAHIVLNLIYLYTSIGMVNFLKKTNYQLIILLNVPLIYLNIFYFSDSNKFLFYTLLINIFYLFVYYYYSFKRDNKLAKKS